MKAVCAKFLFSSRRTGVFMLLCLSPLALGEEKAVMNPAGAGLLSEKAAAEMPKAEGRVALPEKPDAAAVRKKKSERGGPIQKTERAAARRSFPKSKTAPYVPFSQAFPEDITNQNFPDRVDNFDYPNATLLELTEAIGKLTGLNFILNPGLAGKRIKITAPSQITVAEAYKAFLTVLAANKYTLVKKGAFWKIAPSAEALKDNLEIYSGDYFPNTDQLITRIIKLNNINAKKFTDSIKHLVSHSNAMSHHEETNSVIISEYGSVVEKIMKLVEKIDIPGSKEEVYVIAIQHADSNDLSGILNQLIFKSGGRRGAPPSSFSNRRHIKRAKAPSLALKSSSDMEGNMKISIIISDERTNSLVISANQRGYDKVNALVRKLDTYVDPSRSGGIYVYPVLYGTADQIYETLTGIGGGSGRAGPERGKRPGYRRPSYPSSGGGKSSVSPLFDNVTIMADKHTNSLIVSARNRYDFERVKSVLKKIDVPRDQVFVQAAIVEMDVAKGHNWQVNLASILNADFIKEQTNQIGITDSTKPKDTFFPIAGFLNQAFSIQSLQQGLAFGPGLVLGAPLQKMLNILGAGEGGSGTSAENIKAIDELTNLSDSDRQNLMSQSIRAGSQLDDKLRYSMFPLLQLLKSNSNLNVLSTPQIMALDNITAHIEVGENAPVGLTTTTTGNAAVGSVERQDVTIRLEITPNINVESGTVQLAIKQKFNDFSPKASAAQNLASQAVHIIKREIETTLVLNDGETAVLGGLMVDKEDKNVSKIPFLGDLPVLGWLFKGSRGNKRKRNLLVFLTPAIIQGESQREDAKSLLSRKLEERIHFVKRYMQGKDPYGRFFKDLTGGQGSFPTGFLPKADPKEAGETSPLPESGGGAPEPSTEKEPDFRYEDDDEAGDYYYEDEDDFEDENDFEEDGLEDGDLEEEDAESGAVDEKSLRAEEEKAEAEKQPLSDKDLLKEAQKNAPAAGVRGAKTPPSAAGFSPADLEEIAPP